MEIEEAHEWAYFFSLLEEGISPSDRQDFIDFVLGGNWKDVIDAYEADNRFHKMNISEGIGTALHVAVNCCVVRIAKALVDAILKHDKSALKSTNDQGDTPLHQAASRGLKNVCQYIIGENGERKELIAVKNKMGETPLFKAALLCKTETFVYLSGVSDIVMDALVRNDGDTILHCAIGRGFFDLAIIMLQLHPHLSGTRNKEEVTPLEVLATRPSAFKSGINLSWWDEFIYKYITVELLDPVKELELHLTKKDESEELEQKDIIVEPLDLYEELNRCLGKKDESEELERKEKDQNHLSILLQPDLQTSHVYEDKEVPRFLIPPNYATCFQFPYILQLGLKYCLNYFLGFSRLGIKSIRNIKQNHIWGTQLLDLFMEDSRESYMGDDKDKQPEKTMDAGTLQRQQGYAEEMDKKLNEIDKVVKDTSTDKKRAHPDNKTSEQTMDAGTLQQGFAEEKDKKLSEIDKVVKDTSTDKQRAHPDNKSSEETMDAGTSQRHQGSAEEKDKKFNEIVKVVKDISADIKRVYPDTTSNKGKVDKKETAILVAAKNGIVEIVDKLIVNVTSALHDTNSKNENVLLVAVKYRQSLLVERLHKRLPRQYFETIILGVDDNQNTVLHLAASTQSNTSQTWQIAGAAMQMVWEIKWYEYIKGLAPEHLVYRNNEDGETAGELFKVKHNELVTKGAEWLNTTSESCSVVAGLIAGVSFATSSTIPGGTKSDDSGKPALQGQSAFDAFAISSLIGLFFSVTALIMFLSILTSRKEAKDFRRSLPYKLLFGLSSLFISIASMLVSFCAGHFFVLKDTYKHVLFPVYVATCLPITFYAMVQFPLYIDIVATILGTVPRRSTTGDDL